MKALLGAVPLAAAIALIGGPTAASQSSVCAVQTQKQLREQAQLIFDGVALRGPNYRGELLSPARFRVSRYWKGHGDRFVRVRTRTRKLNGGVYATITEGIDPRRGERWRIYGRRAKNGVVQTSICSGSGRFAR